MALDALRCNHLAPLSFKGLIFTSTNLQNEQLINTSCNQYIVITAVKK